VSHWVDLIPFIAEVRDALVSLGALSTLSSQMFRGGKTSVNSALLKDFSGLALLIGHLFDPDALKRKAAICEWRDWRWVRPVTNGDDLRKLGVPPGPIYAKLLGRLRAAWLDSEVKSLAEEQALLSALIADMSTV
jgi:tRNA nucleotidyltransferase (CCA-adding enzyme)